MQAGKSFIKFIVIIVILVGVIIWGTQLIIKEADSKKLETISTDMLLIQAKAKVIFETYHVDNSNGLKGRKVENNAELELFGINDNGNYYIWDKEILNELGLKEVQLEEDDFYIVNYDSEEVLFSKGHKEKDGNIYFKLTDIKNLLNQNTEAK